MFKKTLLTLAAALGFSQVGASQQVTGDIAPPATTNQLLDRLKDQTTPVLRDDLVVYPRHEYDVIR